MYMRGKHDDLACENFYDVLKFTSIKKTFFRHLILVKDYPVKSIDAELGPCPHHPVYVL